MAYDPFEDDDETTVVIEDDDEAEKRPADYGDGEGDDDDDGLTPEQVAEALERFKAKRFDPKPFAHRASKKRIAIVDSETDPFARGVIVLPFTIGFYDGERYVDFWGDDCVIQFFEYLATLDEQFIIYAHNGGKFDFFFFLKYLDKDQSPLIMNGRLVKINFGGQEFRDSYAIIPQALSTYKKDEIDYAKFTRDRREAHRVEILAYQKTDCIYCYELIDGFHTMFGDKLTIASASLPMLNSLHGFEKFKGDAADEKFRRYYFGGRNQCFEKGILKPHPGERWQLIDRNSMYPAVMRDELHPISASYDLQRELDDDTDFACIEAINDGALPLRADDGSLDFTVKRAVFYATMHEIRAGLETGRLKILRVRHAWRFHRKASFREFVEQFYNLRLEAKANGDAVRDILYKFVLNSGYGKFALNPRKFKQWTMTIDEIPQPQATLDQPDGWKLHSTSGVIMIWSRPNPRRSGFYNIATAASITGAARANLLRTISICQRPIYCDTDSVLCERFNGKEEPTILGGWKLEATGDTAAIAGKKLYALFDSGEAIKKASKGVNLSPAEIMRVCAGEEITYENPVPTFRLGRDLADMGETDFITRRINMTGIIDD
jgi:hypothetical protein